MPVGPCQTHTHTQNPTFPSNSSHPTAGGGGGNWSHQASLAYPQVLVCGSSEKKSYSNAIAFQGYLLDTSLLLSSPCDYSFWNTPSLFHFTLPAKRIVSRWQRIRSKPLLRYPLDKPQFIRSVLPPTKPGHTPPTSPMWLSPCFTCTVKIKCNLFAGDVQYETFHFCGSPRRVTVKIP